MKQSLVNQALEIILHRKQLAEAKAQEAFSNAFKNPQFKNAYQALQQAIMQKAKDDAFAIKNDGSQLKKCQNEYENVKKSLKIDNLSPNYHCNKCNDNGFVDGEYCTCLKKQIALISLKILSNPTFQYLKILKMQKRYMLLCKNGAHLSRKKR